jgi:B12-binding domain/radical SAM domain protein
MRNVRFTFISDRFNRTSVAALLAALERLAGEVPYAARVVRYREADSLAFDESGGARAEVLCMSAMTFTRDRALDLHRRLRDRREPATFVSICGGPDPTGRPLGVLEEGFDYACVGEGEETIANVARRLAGGRSPDDVDGLFHLERRKPEVDGQAEGENVNGGMVVKGRRPHAPLDLDLYPPLPLGERFPAHIEIGRGCRWACGYCQTPQIHGHRERFRSLEAIYDMVSSYAAFAMKDFRFVLPNALGYASSEPGVVNCEALDNLLSGTRARARGGRIFLGSFPSEVRPDYVTGEAIRILKAYVSNRQIVIGGQSGSERILDLLGRGHTVEDIRRACDIVLSCGLLPAVDVVLGFPGEAREDRRVTLDLVRELGGGGAVFNMHFFTPLPGTSLAREKPRYLSEAERTELDRLAQQGIVRGGWRRQEELARRWVNSSDG